MEITAAEKLNIIMNRLKITMTGLAAATGQSRQNLTNKFARGNFTEKDLQKIAQAMGCEVKIEFIMPDGTVV